MRIKVDLTVAAGSLLLLLLLLLSTCTHSARAIDAECSACEAVGVELQRKLDDEVLYKVIDMRHRLDKNGQRYGKVIDYRVSEQRAVNLLDGLCSAMDDYTIVKDDIIDRSSGASGAAVSGGGDGGGAAGDDDDGEAAAAAAAPSSPQLMWIKHRGPGATKLPSGSRPPEHEEEMRVKQLTSFCGMLFERYEDEVIAALVSDALVTRGVVPVLCQEITNKCAGKVYAAPSAPAVADSNSHNAEQDGTESAGQRSEL